MDRWSVYILDFEIEKPPRFDPYADELVNFDRPCGHGFVDRVPNIVLEGFQCPCFCGYDDEVFIFEGLDKTNFKLDDEGIFLLKLDSMMTIHRFKVSNFLEKWNCTMDKTELEHTDCMQGPKLKSEVIRYGSSILIFSTCIAYASGDDDVPQAVDFELFTPGHQTTRLLPLRVSRRRGPLGTRYSFYLLHRTSKRERLNTQWPRESLTPTPTRLSPHGGEEVPKFPCVHGHVNSCCGSPFIIQNFSLVDEHIFVVGTSTGVTFCLNLEFPKDWQIFNGPILPGPYRNFVTEGGLILYPSESSVFSNDSIYHSRVELAHSSYVSGSWMRNCLMEIVEGTKFAFIIQLGFDYALRRHWTLDVLRLDVSKFGVCLEMEKERRKKLKEKGIFFTRKEDDEFAKRMKTYKFVCRESGSFYFQVFLFPF